jgi:hypothetical protein
VVGRRRGGDRRASRRSRRGDIGAAEVEVTPDDLVQIEQAASKILVEGARYPENLERMTAAAEVIETCSNCWVT